jgi:hypothetical protein
MSSDPVTAFNNTIGRPEGVLMSTDGGCGDFLISLGIPTP